MNNTLTFGTDGIRGKADEFPFIDNALRHLGIALYSWIHRKTKPKHSKILIAMDTRESGPIIKSSLIEGLCTQSCTVIDAGILPTPGLCAIMKHDLSYDLGIMISASHNPYNDNGIKLFTLGGTKITAEDEACIATLFQQLSQENNNKQPVVGAATSKDFALTYQQQVLSYFPQNFLQGKTIILDCANGAFSSIAPVIFKELGATVYAYETKPNGKNINKNCGALHPENLQSSVVKHNAYAGFAFDGDGDRIVAVNEKGEYRNGDDILWMLSLSQNYQNTSTVVGTVMTNSGLSNALHKNGKTLLRVNVGDKHIVQKLAEEDLFLGGEPSGHIILRDYLSVCDGVFVALRLLQHMIKTENNAMESFSHYPQVLLNIPVSEKRDLSKEPYASTINKYKTAIRDGQLLVRYSGTENLLRIMAETPLKTTSQEIAEALGKLLQKQLQ